MADIDINELQNITALADADELLAIANGLGKNITWAKVKELLTAQLPEATASSKGLKSHNDIMIYNEALEGIDPDSVDNNTIKFTTFSGSKSPTGNDVYGLLFTLVAENSKFRHQLFFNNGIDVYRRFYTAQTGYWTEWIKL